MKMQVKFVRLAALIIALAALAGAYAQTAAGATRDAGAVRRAASRGVKVYLVALDDNGKLGKKIGCNDSLVAVTREVAGVGAPLRAAIQQLLTTPLNSGSRPELYNVLAHSRGRLRIRSVSVNNRGEAVIRLSGVLVTGGVCDAPRVEAQFEQTARQFPNVRRVRVFINNTSLSEYLSEAD